MKKAIYISIIIIFFISCYSVRKAQKQVIKAHLTFPIVTSNFCAETYTIKEKTVEKTKFIKGETIVKTDTITVDCDSIVADKKTNNKVIVKYRNVYKTDTIVKEKTIVKENTAKIKNLQLQIKAKDKTINKKNKLISIMKYLLIVAGIAFFILFKTR